MYYIFDNCYVFFIVLVVVVKCGYYGVVEVFFVYGVDLNYFIEYYVYGRLFMRCEWCFVGCLNILEFFDMDLELDF